MLTYLHLFVHDLLILLRECRNFCINEGDTARRKQLLLGLEDKSECSDTEVGGTGFGGSALALLHDSVHGWLG